MATAGKEFKLYWEGEEIATVTKIKIKIDWSETWAAAYMGRLYAHYFRN